MFKLIVMLIDIHTLYNVTGRGSCLTEEGEVEMDASVMDGSNLRLGGVAAITNIQHPVQVAKTVMEKV